MTTRVELDRARSHWFRRQGLATPLGGPLPALVGRTGWVRTLGGADAYLALRARAPGLRRADLDACIESGTLRVVPGARGCIHIVPADDVALCLALADDAWRARTGRELAKAGSSWDEVAQTATAVLAVLERPMTPDAIRRALPPDSVRSFGERGKKVGLSSALPVALRVLEIDHRIERTLEGGRLDSERYAWRRTTSAPGVAPPDAATRHAILAARFFAELGPATAAHFATWSGLSLRAAKAAMAAVDLAPVDVGGFAPDAFVPARDLDELTGAPASAEPVLLSFEDSYLVSHGGLRAKTDPAHHAIEIDVWGRSGGGPLGEAVHPMSRTVVVGGLIAGIWDLDAAGDRGVWAPLGAVPPRVRKRIDALVADTARFLLDEIGHGRSFSLDTDAAVAARAAAVLARAGTPAAPSTAPPTKAAKAKARKPK